MNPKMAMTCINQLLPYICKVKETKNNHVPSESTPTTHNNTEICLRFCSLSLPVPIKLDKQRLFVQPKSSLPWLMDFVQGVFRHLKTYSMYILLFRRVSTCYLLHEDEFIFFWNIVYWFTRITGCMCIHNNAIIYCISRIMRIIYWFTRIMYTHTFHKFPFYNKFL